MDGHGHECAQVPLVHPVRWYEKLPKSSTGRDGLGLPTNVCRDVLRIPVGKP
ncbi:hypothetical protein B0H12DRAFT_1146373 [Mycena haematopus]|nr:hypothetical protein B0H12DRAFT_1146373 [Mycena haematopus]